jgi:hypothetical protein
MALYIAIVIGILIATVALGCAFYAPAKITAALSGRKPPFSYLYDGNCIGSGIASLLVGFCFAVIINLRYVSLYLPQELLWVSVYLLIQGLLILILGSALFIKTSEKNKSTR